MAVDDDLERCIRQQFRRLVGAVSIVTGSTELAEEAVQEAFARAWERSGRGENFDHLAGWVATVALYLLDVDVAGVAGLLGVSEGTVKTALARAREKLASSLAQPELET